ncbi:MAG: hypothetical protein FJ098_05450 [Deltaproteobacteria bacterium]|nr:hypothetical protein [Deltaproteobacteria bacterium]
MARKLKTTKTLFPMAREAERKVRASTALEERQIALLDELGRRARELTPDELLEGPFHRDHGELYFELRSAFGSYYRSLAALARLLTSPRLEQDEALEGLRNHWRTGAALDEAHFLLTDPLLGRALLQHFGSLAGALEAAALDPGLARRDRRLDDAALLERSLPLLGRTAGRTAKEWEALDPLLMEAVRLRFERTGDFFGWLDAQMADRPVFHLLRDRREVVRLLAAGSPPVGRGGKGRLLEGKRFDVGACIPGGRNVLALAASGLLFRLRPDQVPVDGAEGFRLPLERADRIVALLAEPAGDEHLAIATALGRVKAIPAAAFRGFLSEGVRAAGLEEGDTCTAACRVVPDGGDLVALTAAGNGLRLDPGELRDSSRLSRGVLRVRPREEGDGVSALFQARREYVVLTRDGRVRRGAVEELPLPRARATGVVAARGEVAGGAGIEHSHLAVLSRAGRLLVFEVASLRPTSRYARGVTAMRLDRGDRAAALFPVP